MVYYNNILCVEARWLVDNGVMTVRQYRHLRDSNQIYIARRGCRGTPALVSYDSIPERFKPMVKEVLGCDPREAAKVSQVESRIVHDAEISRYFEEDYLLPDGRRLPKETRAEYYANAIVLEAIGRLLSDKTAFKRSRSSGRVTHNWKRRSPRAFKIWTERGTRTRSRPTRGDCGPVQPVQEGGLES